MLNVAALHEVPRTAGLGALLMVWLQGCEKSCPGCMNADFRPRVVRRLLAAEDVLARLHAGLEGLWLSGGEPFLQAAELLPLVRGARARGFAVLSYSGYTRQELEANVVPQARDLLAELDVLIDGEFVPELAGSYLWRGSSNQRIHLLSARYNAALLEHPPGTSVQLAGGTAVLVGSENLAFQRLLGTLRELGVAFVPPRGRSLDGGTAP